MSTAKLEEIHCPCGEEFEAELWNSINPNEDPELKEALLCGEINVVCCPKCGQIFHAENFLLYHDSASEILAFVYPASFAGEAARWKERMENDFARATAATPEEERIEYRPVLLFGLEDLVNIIREDEAENDEVAIMEYTAREFGMTPVPLIPSLAREHSLPKCLPLMPLETKGLRDQILSGLRLLIQHNGHLTRYSRLLGQITKDRGWTLDKELVKGKKIRAGKVTAEDKH